MPAGRELPAVIKNRNYPQPVKHPKPTALRQDQSFARGLRDALARSGRKCAWDQDSTTVRFSAPWRAEVRAAIQASDKFIFVISPSSLTSQPCADELSHAAELNKQIIPVLRRRPAAGQPVPDGIEEINWVYFDDDVVFEVSFAQLAEAIDTDLVYATTHTRLLVRSAEWVVAARDHSLLLQRNLFHLEIIGVTNERSAVLIAGGPKKT
jgi:hypothetical protein